MLWRIESVSEGVYQIIPAGNLDIAVDVYGAHTNAGAELLLYNRNSNNNQKFSLIIDAPVDYDVCGVCSGGNTGIVPTADISLCPVGLKNNTVNDNISIAPNPFRDETILSLPKGVENAYAFTLFNMQGAVVLKKEGIRDTQLIFGNNLSKGIYTGKLIQGREFWIVKVVKN